MVSGLEAERILFRLTSMSRSWDYFAYNIQPWFPLGILFQECGSERAPLLPETT